MNREDALSKSNTAAWYYIEWLEAHMFAFASEDVERERRQYRDEWRAAFNATLPTADDVRGILA